MTDLDGDPPTADPTDAMQRGDLVRMHRRAIDQGIVVHVAGEVDLASTLGRRTHHSEGQARSPAPVVIDLTEVTFLAPVGLRIPIEQNRLCREADLELRMVARNRMVARTITRTGLADTFAVFPPH